MPQVKGNEQERDWTFLTNHAHVLLCLAADHDVRLRTVAQQVGITERAVQLIVADLEAAGYVTRTRVGRRNHYAIQPRRALRHPLERHRTVAVLLDIVEQQPESAVSPQTRAAATRRAGPAPESA